MLRNYIVLIILPVMAYCHISVRVKADTKPDNVAVDFSGWDEHIISDEERLTFGLTDKRLQDVSKKIFGERCYNDNVFVKEPTPWGTYTSYKWPQVKTTLRPIRAKVLSIKSKPVAVTTAEFVNHSNITAKYGTTLSQTVENTISSTWTKGGELSVGHTISYGINIEVANAGGSTSLSYTSSWGEETKHEGKVTLGSTLNVETELTPHRGVLAKLIATRGALEVEIEYEATVDGYVFCNFNPQLNGHYWHAAYVSQFQRYGGFPISVKSFEVLSIGFYTTSRTEVTDLHDF